MYFLNIENTTHTKKRCACTPHMGNRGRERERQHGEFLISVWCFSLFHHTPQIIPTSSHSLSTSRVGAVCLAGRSIPATIRLPRPSCPARSVRRSTRAASTFFHHHLLNFFFVADAVLPDKHGTSISRAPSTHLARRQRSARVPLKDGASPL